MHAMGPNQSSSSTLHWIRFVVFSLVCGALIVSLSGCSVFGGGATPTKTARPKKTAAPTEVPSATTKPTITLTPSKTPIPSKTPTITSSPTATEVPSQGEIFFLRGSELIARDLDVGAERQLATNVQTFAVSRDGSLIAIVRVVRNQPDLWLVDRNGENLHVLTQDDRVEGDMTWDADNSAIAYTSTAKGSPMHKPMEWKGWSQWCAEGQIQIISLNAGIPSALPKTLGKGCEPVFSPDGLRIAYASAPSARSLDSDLLDSNNTIHLINREGANGWDLASAVLQKPSTGILVYAPSWTPDGAHIAYQRFMGYQALVDIGMTELADSNSAEAVLLSSGAGWMRPVIFTADGKNALVIEHNYSDARGATGYDTWRLTALEMNTRGTTTLPDGERRTEAAVIQQFFRVTNAIWFANGTTAGVSVPPEWSNDPAESKPGFDAEGPAAVRQWKIGGNPDQTLVEKVDFGSPLVWLKKPQPPIFPTAEGATAEPTNEATAPAETKTPQGTAQPTVEDSD